MQAAACPVAPEENACSPRGLLAGAGRDWSGQAVRSDCTLGGGHIVGMAAGMEMLAVMVMVRVMAITTMILLLL